MLNELEGWSLTLRVMVEVELLIIVVVEVSWAGVSEVGFS